jgi:hypothetical protein
VKLSETNPGDRIKIGISQSGYFTFGLSGAYRIIEVVVAGHHKVYPDQSYIVWEHRIPEFEGKRDANQSIRRIRRQQYRISNKFNCGYHILDNIEVEIVKAAKQKSAAASSLPLLLACVGAGAALTTLSSQSITNQKPKSQKVQK